MKIMVHDYCGHPGQIQLSRQLASRGHDVIHIYYADNHGPKGAFARPGDPASLRVIGIRLERIVAQTALVARLFNDLTYGRRVAEFVRQMKPDVIISGNTPPDAQGAILKACKSEQISFVYWVQDIYSIALTKLLAKQFGLAGSAIGWYYRWLDRHQFRKSDAIVVITEDFAPLAAAWGGSEAKVTIIENWGALDDCPAGIKDNNWSRAHSLHDNFTFLYSGTLGRKHNPMLLHKLAQEFGPDAAVTVVAQGVGMKQLEATNEAHRADALRLLPLQPVEQYADVLATADVLVATIETDAGTFAVPSKVLSYLCAGRPILLAAPGENLAARTVARANAGIVVDPADEAGFLAAAGQLRGDPKLRARLGANGRAYAERTFDLTRIADQFDTVFRNARSRSSTIVEGVAAMEAAD
jgi:colanic acid biosynthesis glycosyl transferase WcaI